MSKFTMKLLKHRTGEILPILLIILFSTSVVSAQGFLRTQGTKIINDNGEVLLRGMGLGGWLVPEGYMLGTSAFANSPTQIRNKIEALVGTENRKLFYQKYQENFVTKADIDQLKEFGFNSVRLVFHWDKLTPPDQPGVWLEPGFAQFDSVIAWCKTNGMYVILDMHCAPGAQSGEPISDSDGQARLWQDESFRIRTVEIWRKIAERYKDETTVGGYDLINEPAWDLGSTNALLRELFINITNSIREVDQNHILFIEGNWFATDFKGLTPKWDDNMVYSFHRYWAETSSSSIQYLLTLRNQEQVPLWCGESGENSNPWFTSMIRTLEVAKIGWSWWTIKKIEGAQSIWSVKKDPGFDLLLKYWSGTGSKPSVSVAMTALYNQAENLKLANCRPNLDVINSMFNQIFKPGLYPYKNHEIPGRIYAVDYDMGNQNQAYFDKDYQNTGGAGGGTWNAGWTYRNDGVDIEKCADATANTNGYDVGWTNNGEWLKYTVNVKTAGVYNLVIRHASGGSVGTISLYTGSSSLLSTKTIPNTGGWQAWKSIVFPDITLQAGSQVLKIEIPTAGYNLNYLEFQLVTPISVDDKTQPEKFKLNPAYPNPFNPSTQVSFSLPEAGQTVLTVFNMLGQPVKKLASQVFPAGNHELTFDAAGLPSGTYFIRLETNFGMKVIPVQLVK